MLYTKFFKRVIDIFVSGLGLIILSPVLLVLAVLVRVRLGAPVLFIQERPGKDEKIFRLCKFRTMKTGDGSDEDRMTPFGSKLRSLSLDELPELWNIFKGDMSIVGPRPLLVKYLPRYNDEQRRRHDVRPGLTGLAQVNGRNALTWEDKFKYDVQYAEELSFGLDVEIFFKTIKSVLKREGISAEGDATMPEFMGTEE